jgi:hypothetical protein
VFRLVELGMTDPYGGVRATSPGEAPPGVCLVHRVKAATNRAWTAALGDGQWRTSMAAGGGSEGLAAQGRGVGQRRLEHAGGGSAAAK